VQEYRLYCLDGAGKITRAEAISAAADEEAIMIARAAHKRVRCELWQRDRLVAEIPPWGG
jgi:hypothetical protein